MWGMTKAWDVVDIQCCSQRFTGRREEPPTSFTLFSSKLQVQIMWSDTHDNWHDVSQTLKHSRRGGCTVLQATNQAAQILLQLHCSAFPSWVCHHFCQQRWRRFTFETFCLIFIVITGVYTCVIVPQIWIWVYLFIHFIFFMQHITLLFTSLKSCSWLYPRWVKKTKKCFVLKCSNLQSESCVFKTKFMSCLKQTSTERSLIRLHFIVCPIIRQCFISGLSYFSPQFLENITKSRSLHLDSRSLVKSSIQGKWQTARNLPWDACLTKVLLVSKHDLQCYCASGRDFSGTKFGDKILRH